MYPSLSEFLCPILDPGFKNSYEKVKPIQGNCYS